MNIRVVKDNGECTHFTGGEYAIPNLEIHVDASLPIRTQRALIRHAVIENYCRSWEHTKVEELTELIQDALDQLEEGEDKG